MPPHKIVLATMGLAFVVGALTVYLVQLEANTLTAFATVALAVFAGTQVTREILAYRRRKAATLGPRERYVGRTH